MGFLQIYIYKSKAISKKAPVSRPPQTLNFFLLASAALFRQFAERRRFRRPPLLLRFSLSAPFPPFCVAGSSSGSSSGTKRLTHKSAVEKERTYNRTGRVGERRWGKSIAMSVTAGVSDAVIAIREKLRGKIGQTKVKRYWPGKAPEWADEADEDADIRTSRQVLDQAFPLTTDSQIAQKDDPRLRRLAESRVVDREEVRADHRRIRQAEIISTEEEESRGLEGADAEEEDEDAMEERRRRIREKLLQRQQEETAPLEEEEVAEEESESEEESEYETDSDEEDVGGISLVKPVFVPKSERDTIAERERLEAEEVALEEAVRRRLEERKVETKQIVVEKIREEQEIQKNMEAEEANIADVDTDDELNEAEEYESWKAREIGRIKRDREAREAMIKAKEEIERVRNMTEEERREWERKNPRPGTAPKQKWRFMQKYYHKGAFFQSDADDQAGTAGADGIYTRDFSSPTGEDKMDKTILPKVMQVKHFGRSGRTKWTHLVNEDTTDWNNPWTYNDPLRAKYNAKMAGMNKPIEKPKGSKKLKDWESR